MRTTPLNQLFEIEYGNQFDFNKMELDSKGISFVSRSSRNLGVVARVKELDVRPYQEGRITVTLGGTYLLSAFVQLEPFYTAQNIKVLSSKKEMSFNTKVFYCYCIGKNRFRYSSHGREANRSLGAILVPSIGEVPDWIREYDYSDFLDSSSVLKSAVKLSKSKWAWFEYDSLFEIVRGAGARKSDITETGTTRFITSIDSNNGLSGYVDLEPKHLGNVITVNRNGSIAEAFYQDRPFCSTEDVHVFIPKFELNKYIGLFLSALIRKERYRFSYGRKWGIARMKKSKIKLPVGSDSEPDWELIEKYIKSLPYSASV